MIRLTWKQVDARPDNDFVVAPDERLGWVRTIGIGAQHVVAMFGATFLVPVLTGFPPATTLLFSGVGTVLFLLITGNRLPSYLGSSFSVIAPVTAAVASHGTGSALGGLVAVGLALIVIGAVGPSGRHALDRRDVAAGGHRGDRRTDRFQPRAGREVELREGPARRRRHPGAAGGDAGVLPRHHRTAGDLHRRRRRVRAGADPRRRRHLGHQGGAVAGPARIPDPDVHVGGAADVPARGDRAGRREHRARQVGRPDDRYRRRPGDGPCAGRRRRGHDAGRLRRRVRRPPPTPRTSA